MGSVHNFLWVVFIFTELPPLPKDLLRRADMSPFGYTNNNIYPPTPSLCWALFHFP